MLTTRRNRKRADRRRCARGAVSRELDFQTGTVYFTNWGDTLIVGGNSYIGTGDLVQIQGLSESVDLAARSLTFAISIVNSAMLAALSGPSSNYRRRRARVLPPVDQ